MLLVAGVKQKIITMMVNKMQREVSLYSFQCYNRKLMIKSLSGILVLDRETLALTS